MMNLVWPELTLIAFDIETSGAYPLDSEICEIAAVKWEGGEIVAEFQTLVKPTKPMSDFIIGIHGITNEMVTTAPMIKEKIGEFREFIEGGILVAHHAPFDLGFLSVEFERFHQALPSEPVLCTSLISRKVITDSENHKLQTLIKHLGLMQGQAHRALDDTKACLELALHCLNKFGEEKTLAQILELQEKSLYWKNYSIQSLLRNDITKTLVNAIEKKIKVDIIYQGGSLKGTRTIWPKGIVRNPDGDYLAALDDGDVGGLVKRFYLGKIKEACSI
ncbi:MAG: 3'-5' exonuclease [Pseudomonadota bacterium]|nr:3'-5' exonuclease [Pseudomonadota bacterium]